MGHKHSYTLGFAGGLALVIGVASTVVLGMNGIASKFQQGEDQPGGAATSKRAGHNANAFSHGSGNLGFEDEFTFKLGNGLFRKLWVSSPASTKASDGLGPYYNARACQHCHLKDGRGHPPAGSDDPMTSMLFRIGVPATTPDQVAKLRAHQANTFPDASYGGQIQDVAIQGFQSEATPSIDYEERLVELNGGEAVSLRKPSYRFSRLAFGPFPPDLMVSPRVANQMIGLGLLEAIPEAAILALADPDDADDDGVSGRPNNVWDIAKKVASLGRFGWKAGQPSVKQQAAAAFLGDMGLSTSFFPHHAGDCTTANERCLDAPNGADAKTGTPEITDEMLDLVTFYAANLAVPRRARAKEESVLKGKALFVAAGCAACHTPPLWGIGHTMAVSKHTQFLHDGRARNLLEAIVWHGGEAEAARNRVVQMTPAERKYLLDYLNSL